MDWNSYHNLLREGLYTGQGAIAVFGGVLLAILGTTAVHQVLHKRARSVLSPLGVALTALAGFWLWEASAVGIAIYGAGYDAAWKMFWKIQAFGAIPFPLTAALLAIRRGYTCSWKQTLVALALSALTVLIGAYYLSHFAPLLLSP